MRQLLLPGLFLMLLLTGCQREPGTPKPRAYPRIEYPQRSYLNYAAEGCPFTFEYPAYAEINDKKDHACWFDLYMPEFRARLHCSYLRVKNRKEFDDLVHDAFTIADKINERANFMEQTPVRNAQAVGGLALHFTGPAASPFHFFLTDTTQHFFKASLYFEAEVRPDSLAPIVKFVEEDINHLINSFTWH